MERERGREWKKKKTDKEIERKILLKNGEERKKTREKRRERERGGRGKEPKLTSLANQASLVHIENFNT